MVIVALDFDGTIATDDGELCESARDDLIDLNDRDGLSIVLCTGRRLSYVAPKVEDFCDAIAAENGGVIDWGDTIEVGIDINSEVKEIVKEEFKPRNYDIRRTVIFVDRHPEVASDDFEERIAPYEIVRNNNSFQIRNSEQTKALGLRHASAYQHNEHRIIAAGDSENDIDLLKMADEAIVPANADPGITAGVVGEPFTRGSSKYWRGIRESLFETLDVEE